MYNRYAGIIANDIVDSDKGVCVSFWTQFCPHRCKGCHNPETWSKDGGKPLPENYIEKVMNYIEENGIERNLSILGGEPLAECNREIILPLLKAVKEKHKNCLVYLWSGYVWEDIIDQPLVRDIMKYVDVLIDGPFIQEKRDISLFLRGSDNQRVIDVQKTLESGEVILYHD